MRTELILLLFLLSGLCYAQQQFCDVVPTEPLTLTMPDQDYGNRQVLLSHDAVLAIPQAPGTLQLHQAQTSQLIDQIIQWPDAPAESAPLVAAPLSFDRNYDGITDAVYLTDEQGLVWYIGLTTAGFDTPVLIADLRAEEVVYRQPMLLVQTLQQPAFEHFVSDMQPVVKLIAIGTNSVQQDSIVVFSHQPGQQHVVTLADMTDRTHQSHDELTGDLSDEVWQQWHNAPGWRMQLNSRVIVPPKVYAGVVYFVTNPEPVSGQPCQTAPEAPTDLYAVHLHHAAAVYSARRLSIPALQNASFVVQPSGDDMSLTLQNAEQSQTLLSQMHSISPDCINCTEPLNSGDFPKISRLATFLTEEGAF